MFQDEYHDAHLHPDIVPGSEEVMCPFPNDDPYVEDRWKVLLPMGVLVDDRAAVTRDCWLQFLLSPDDGPITKEIFWTDQAIPAHEPRLVDGAQRADVELWQSITLAISSDELIRLPEKRTVEGRRRPLQGYWLYVRVRVQIEHMNVTATWSRMPSRWNPYTRPGLSGMFTAPPDDQMITIVEENMHDQKYSAFVQRREGGAG